MNIGEVSSGTMRVEDLIPTFLNELIGQKKVKRSHYRLIADIEAKMRASEESGWPNEGFNYFDETGADEDLVSLMDALTEYAPPYFYFGSHPGDGASYGYWLSEGFTEEFDGPKYTDTSEAREERHVGEFLCVTDHGNLSLYVRGRNGHIREVWAIV